MKQKILIVLASVFLISAIICVVAFFNGEEDINYDKLVSSSQLESLKEEPSKAPSKQEVSSELSSESSQIEEDPVEIPVNFDELKDINKDVFAWIDIPNTNVNYPILNREYDNEYYLNRDINEKYSGNGSLFMEDYNDLSFNDPVNIIYGHNMRSGAMFGNLDSDYNSLEKLKDVNTVYVYLPNEIREYKIFAAVPYSKKHILYYNNFSDPNVFDSFITEIKNTRSLSAVIDDSVAVANDDKILILSTCSSNGSSRFLVLAVEQNLQKGENNS